MTADIQQTTNPQVHGVDVRVRDAEISFGDHTVLAGVDLDIRPGEFVCLLGPSGCGKSTLLSALAGFVQLSDGTIECDGNKVPKGNNPYAGKVFQSAEALFDWMTAEQNVSYGARMRGASRSEQKAIAKKYLTMVGLGHSGDKYPSQLSGGMKQRVQIARVLANEPQLVLMDEPFGALDAQTRNVLQGELSEIWRSTGCTIVFVTHDIDEAVALADRVVVMSAGPRARIKSVYEIDAERPRARGQEDLVDIWTQLRDDISVEVARTMREQGIEGTDH